MFSQLVDLCQCFNSGLVYYHLIEIKQTKRNTDMSNPNRFGTGGSVRYKGQHKDFISHYVSSNNWRYWRIQILSARANCKFHGMDCPI
jgi:hypothetical protein